MESSIAEFLMGQPASEQLPTCSARVRLRWVQHEYPGTPPDEHTDTLPAFYMQGTSSAEDCMTCSLQKEVLTCAIIDEQAPTFSWHTFSAFWL